MTEVMHVDKQIFDGNSETSASEALSSDSDIPDEDYGGDSEDETEDIENENDGEKSENKQHGLADVMSKILNKNVPKHKKTILLKAKTERELQKLRKAKRGDDSDDEADYIDVFEKLEKKKLWENMGRVKPHPLDKDRERHLQRIATRGVVQLFNAVRKQQKLLGDKLVEAGASVRKQDKVMESMTKGKFLDLLKGASSGMVVKVEKEEIKEEPADTEEGDKWSILRDDFMMGAKMKDWDKENSGDEGGGQVEMEGDNDDIDDMTDSE